MINAMDKEYLSEKAQLRLKKLKELNLPEYSTLEEFLNALSHGIGAVLSIIAIVLLIVNSPFDAKSIICVSIYSVSLFVLYIISTLYHAILPGRAKMVFRVLDHCSIFVLIAGTYTPICLLMLNSIVGWILFFIVWTAAIVGIVFNSIDMRKFSKFSMVCYIAMGWVVIFAFKPLIESITSTELILLILGGIAYTVGAVLYVLGKKKKYVHSIWHLFVLIGSILHFLMVFNGIKNM